MGKWTERARAAQQITDTTDKTPLPAGVLSVVSVIPNAREASNGGFVGCVGESVRAEHGDLGAPPEFCLRHNRPFTDQEHRAGRCSWCHSEDRRGWRDKNAAWDRSTDKTDETGVDRRSDDPESTSVAELEAERARAAVDGINAEMRRRWTRAEHLEQSDNPEDRFVTQHHRAEVRGAVTACWLPAMRRWATLVQRLGRLDPEHAWLAEGEDGGRP